MSERTLMDHYKKCKNCYFGHCCGAMKKAAKNHPIYKNFKHTCPFKEV